MRKICMVGAGYVGLVTGTCLADFGNEVICVDVDEGKIATLNEGNIPFYEPGLRELVGRNKGKNRLKFTTSLAESINPLIGSASSYTCQYSATGLPVTS